jgi:hypothetical protein
LQGEKERGNCGKAEKTENFKNFRPFRLSAPSAFSISSFHALSRFYFRAFRVQFSENNRGREKIRNKIF